MKTLFAVALAMSVATADARLPSDAYPSCDLAAQHALKGDTGGTMTDPRQAHLSMRANILQADIGNARKARRLGQAQADALWQRVDALRQQAAVLTRRQGFLSAAERASHDRALDAVAMRLCRR